MPQACPTVYLNGQFLPRADAHLDIEDRGSLFADGVYEVIAYFHGRPLAMEAHLARMRRSLAAIDMAPAAADALDDVSHKLVDRNGLSDAMIYWQITRGAGPRDHVPDPALSPTVLAIAYPGRPLDLADPPHAIRVGLAEDLRWQRCDIKSLMLLANVLAMTTARRRGFDDVILHRGDRITEAARTSVFGVRRGVIHTHPADPWILPSITRAILLELARGDGLDVREQAMAIDELRACEEVLTCGTGSRLQAVTHIEDRPVGDGKIGPVTARLHHLYMRHIARSCGLTGA